MRDQTNFVSEQLDGHESGPGSDEYPVWPDVDNYLSIDVFWPHPQDGPWKVTVHWATLDERQVVIGLDLRCFARSGVRPGGWRYEDGGPAEVTREVFKRLPVASLIEQSRAMAASLTEPVWMRVFGRTEPKLVHIGSEEQIARYLAVAEGRAPRKGRPRDHEPDFYAAVADLYSEAVRAGGEPARKPAKYVQERLVEQGLLPDERSDAGLHRSQANQVRKYIQTARKEGLLPAAGPRRNHLVPQHQIASPSTIGEDPE